ncbi:MAG: hypothetical protein OXE87_07255 [Chloroflexi bacterium]|nr:hypothetical protein [Chloroflexota bacterium]
MAMAANRQTTTYNALAQKLGYQGAGQFMSGLLDPVMLYCQANSLPPLTVLVVNQETGKPGAGLAGALQDADQERERVFNYRWFHIFPPTPQDFDEVLGRRNV